MLNRVGVERLSQPLEAFVRWLEEECGVEDLWLPSIGLKITIKVKRITFIKICGNIGKHNFSRLGINVDGICKILKESGTSIDPRIRIFGASGVL
jgi:hypothetical protein